MTTTVVPVRPGEMTRASRHKEVPVGEQEPKEEPPSPLQPQEKKTKETKKKQKQAKVMSLDSPYPDFARPSAAECRAVEQVLLGVHGPPPKAEEMTFEDDEPGPEGQAIVTDRGKSESILDAVIRVVLGLNTSARCYRLGKQGLDQRFGRGNYEAIRQAKVEDVVEALWAGGLANRKARTIKNILNAVWQRNQETSLSLEFLHDMDDEQAWSSLFSLYGVGPKTAAVIMSYQLKRDFFAVDTHVFRICGQLGWIPKQATRETAFLHLNARIPSEHKHNLHVLFINHGRSCPRCKATATAPAERSSNKTVNRDECVLSPFMRNMAGR